MQPVPIMIPSRRVLKIETFKKIMYNKAQFRGSFFLFSDSIFIGKNVKGKAKIKYCTHLPLFQLTVIKDDAEGGFILSGRVRVACYPESPVVVDSFITEIQEAVKAVTPNNNNSILATPPRDK
jgi:hypothetical protein